MEAKILKSTKKLVNYALKLQRPLSAASVGQKFSSPCYLIDIL